MIYIVIVSDEIQKQKIKIEVKKVGGLIDWWFMSYIPECFVMLGGFCNNTNKKPTQRDELAYIIEYLPGDQLYLLRQTYLFIFGFASHQLASLAAVARCWRGDRLSSTRQERALQTDAEERHELH